MSGKLKALIVYESMFGNTQAIAEGICEGLGARLDVELIEVGRAPARVPPAVDLLVVGGPTHVFGMSRPRTRTDASAREPMAMSPDIGIREWIGQLPDREGPVMAATFDTRLVKGRQFPGSAARGAAKLLRRLQYPMLAEPTSYYVQGTMGTLLDGELERARHWGGDLADALRRLGSDLEPGTANPSRTS